MVLILIIQCREEIVWIIRRIRIIYISEYMRKKHANRGVNDNDKESVCESKKKG